MSQLSTVVLKAASLISRLSANTACLFAGYQPQVPASVLKKAHK